MPMEIATPTGTALVDIDRPIRPRGLLVVGHGAGGGVQAPDILAARAAGAAAGFSVVRVTQPYRVLGRQTPPATPSLDTAWTAVVDALRRRRGLRTVPLVLAGRSSGARVACRTAKDLDASGVVALAFPLHPPGRPEKTRLDELELPAVPVLVVQGDRDAFGMPPPAPGRTVVAVPGADHSLKTASATQAVRESVVAFLAVLAED
jgi:predicted alpha/beta-hydrolase family hydrolase